MYVSSCLARTVSALNTPEESSAPSATTPCPSRNRSGRIPLYETGSAALPSATWNVTARLSPRTSEPGCTRPPSRKRLPAWICFSATIAGVEKNTIESPIAFSTRAAATARTTSEPPIIVKPRCLRVMRGLQFCASPCSSIEPEILQTIIQSPQPLCVVGDGLAGVDQRAPGLIAIAHDQISPHQPQPSFNVVAVLLQPAGEPLDHATDHRATVGLIHVFRRRHRTIRQCRSGGTADPRQCGLNQRTPRRVRRRFGEQRTPDRPGLRGAAGRVRGDARGVGRPPRRPA